MGLQARMMSQAMRILTGKCSRSAVSLIFLNQVRDKIGVLYGNPETTTCGRALKFYSSSIRLSITRKEAIWEGTKENIVGTPWICAALKMVEAYCSAAHRLIFYTQEKVVIRDLTK